MRISRSKRVKRLGGKSVEQRVDGISVSSLKSVVRLKAIPGRVLFIDIVIDSNRLNLFVIITRVRDALPVLATVAPVTQRTPEYLHGRAAGISVKRKQLLVKGYRLGRRRVQIVAGMVGVRFAGLELLQHVILKCASWDGSGRDDG